MVNISIVNLSKHSLPEYSTLYSAGMDLYANLDNSVVLRPMERMLIPTGIFIELPVGYEAQVRPRSGLAIKKGLTVLNSPGTIDADYRGEIKVILVNLSDQACEILDGERIAQMVVAQHARVSWTEVKELNKSERGSGGFGHTGV